jgi:phosphatidylinositol glycan class P protein
MTPQKKPSRSIYGFVFYLATYAAFATYLVWAIVPDYWLQHIGLTYLPSKYWGIVVPLYIVIVLITVLIVYFFYIMWLTPSFHDVRTITDDIAIYRHQANAPDIITDIPITKVNDKLYTIHQ